MRGPACGDSEGGGVMSAWDIAGAVVWTMIAVPSWDDALKTDWRMFWVALPTSLASAHCFVRLFGAHA